jgi:hypothetical protein
MVAGQSLRVGRTYAGQAVVIAIEDVVLRVLHHDVELTTPEKQTCRSPSRRSTDSPDTHTDSSRRQALLAPVSYVQRQHGRIRRNFNGPARGQLSPSIHCKSAGPEPKTNPHGSADHNLHSGAPIFE